MQADGDIIFIQDFGPVFLNAVELPEITPDDIRSVSDFPVGGLQPLASFSGLTMDVFVCAEGFRFGNCSFARNGGFVLSTFGRFGSLAGAGDGERFTSFNGLGFNPANWNITPVVIRAPKVITLLGLALVALPLVRRKMGYCCCKF